MEKISLFFKGIQQGFKNFSYTLTNIINFSLLSIVYFIGIGIVSVISKLSGRHFLDLKKQNKASNWHEHKVTKQPLEKYFRTF